MYGIARSLLKSTDMRFFNFFGRKKKNGVWREYNKHAVLITEGTFLNDQKHGLWRYYYDSSELAIEEYYELDRLHGQYRSFYTNGQRMSEGQYEHGSREGYFHVYNEEGLLVRVMLYARNVLITDTPQPQQSATKKLTLLQT